MRGLAAANWRKLDLRNIAVALTTGGQEVVKRNGGHIAGDPLLEDTPAEIGVPLTGRHSLGCFEQFLASQIRLASEP